MRSAQALGVVSPVASREGAAPTIPLACEHAFDSNSVEVNLVCNQGFVWPTQEPMHQLQRAIQDPNAFQRYPLAQGSA